MAVTGRGNVRGRLERPEASAPKPSRTYEARERLKARLDRIAEARRGEVPSEEAEAAIRELDAALERWRERRRGEGVT